MRKGLLVAGTLLLLALIAYFWLDHRRQQLVETYGSNTNLVLDNPSASELRVVIGNDSFEVPPRSTVYYPVNDRVITEGKKHIRSFDLTKNKLLIDTTCALSSDLPEYFLNPSLSRYVKCTSAVLHLYGYRTDQSLQPLGDKMHLFDQKIGDTDSTFMADLLINHKGMRAPFQPKSETTGTEAADNRQSRSEVNVHLVREGSQEETQTIFYSQRWEGFFSPKLIIERE